MVSQNASRHESSSWKLLETLKVLETRFSGGLCAELQQAGVFGDKSESDEELLAAIEAIDPSAPKPARSRGRGGRGSRGGRGTGENSDAIINKKKKGLNLTACTPPCRAQSQARLMESKSSAHLSRALNKRLRDRRCSFFTMDMF